MGNVVRQNVSFMPVDFATVQAVAKDAGLTFSGSLRVIIRDWVKQQRLRDVGRAYASGVITAEEAVEKLAGLVETERPVARVAAGGMG
jgi:hypothetical protein